MPRVTQLCITFAIALIGASSPFCAWAAQKGGYTGTVYRDSLDHPLAGTMIVVHGVNITVVSDDRGDFRVPQLPAGRYAITLRHVGFAPLTDTLTIASDGVVDRAYEMSAEPVALAPVNVREKTAPAKTYATPRLNEFLERKNNSIGGHFITEEVLRKSDSRKLQDVVASNIPGLRVYRREGWEYLSSGRGACQSRSFECPGGVMFCPVTLYIDGMIAYNPGLDQKSANVPDMSRINIADYAGIEYYAGGASVPLQYNASTGNCGVLLLWTRER